MTTQTIPAPVASTHEPDASSFPGLEITHPSMAHEELLARLEDTSLEHFPHHEHVRAAWLLLRHHPPLDAIGQFARMLRRFAAAKGAHGLYHETITWAFVLLINERMERHGRELDWASFCTANPDLLSYRPSPLEGYYRAATLAGELARRVFLLPDRGIGESPRP